MAAADGRILHGASQTLLDLTEMDGQPPYRLRQMREFLLSGVSDPNDMTNLPKELRESLSKIPSGYPTAEKTQKAADGTQKVLWRYADGATVESVLMSYKHGTTACLSTQVGCRMGCAFCASCKDGLLRNLTAGEILGQFLALKKLAPGGKIEKIVLMGMGEPLDNLDNVICFLVQLRKSVSPRNVSVSTCGVIGGIERLAAEKFPVTLSVSLHAADDEKRSRIMPINRKYPIAELMSACREFFRKTGRRVSFEYVLIGGFNDAETDAKKLASLCRGQHINLLRLNPIAGADFRPSDNTDKFRAILEKSGVTVTVRRRLGNEIEAACGQLRRSK